MLSTSGQSVYRQSHSFITVLLASVCESFIVDIVFVILLYFYLKFFSLLKMHNVYRLKKFLKYTPI